MGFVWVEFGAETAAQQCGCGAFDGMHSCQMHVRVPAFTIEIQNHTATVLIPRLLVTKLANVR